MHLAELTEIAGGSGSKSLDAQLVLREVSPESLPACTETVQKPKARAVGQTTPDDMPAEVTALERELLQELHRGSLSDVEGDELHRFCTEKEWKNPAVKSLWFDRWLPAYWKTESGSRKLAQLETYGLMHKNADKRSEPDLARIAVIAELRRRIRTDEEFCGMLSQGVSEGRLPMDFISMICADIWQEPTQAESELAHADN